MLLLLGITILPLTYYVACSLLSDVGIVKCKRGQLTVNTTSGVINLPNVTMPSYDWDVRFFTEKSGFAEQNGVHCSSVLDNFTCLRANVTRNILICEYFYPEDIGKEVKCVINSPFDDLCYVKSLQSGKPIDYKMLCDQFALEIEQM
jgi:hypothetical protein